jgi:hypothetical protein
MLCRHSKITLIPAVTILTVMLNIDINSPQNLCVFSIRIAEYIARQLNTLTHKRYRFGKIDLNIKWVSLTRVAL